MAQNQILFAGQDNVDVVAAYGYPATCLVEQVKNGAAVIHKIWYGGASSTLFANAPNGSILYNTASTPHIELKKGTLGASDGTWSVIA